MGAEQGNMREIWGIGTPRSFRPIWVCEELGLDYQDHMIQRKKYIMYMDGFVLQTVVRPTYLNILLLIVVIK